MGMAPLAGFLVDDGAEVSGFDDNPDENIRAKLEESGVSLRIPSPGESFDCIIISTALKLRLGELRKRICSKELLMRGEAWAKICASRKLTAVVGSHGKSTVSAMLAHAAKNLETDCGWLVGAVPRGFPMHRYCKSGSGIISEIDESDATIEGFSPENCVALNADLDHTDTYSDEKKLYDMFRRLFALTKRSIIYNSSDSALSDLAKASGKKTVPVDASGNFEAINFAMAVAAIQEVFGADETTAKSSLDDFQGLLRRQETIFKSQRIYAVADYAHHPNEVASFLRWFSGKCGIDENNILFFQPHRYSRTRRFAESFARILSGFAESEHMKIYILPVYAASEPRDPLGESSAISALSDKITLARKEDFPEIISTALKSGRKLNAAIVGAGDFYFEAKKFFNDNL